MISSGDRGAARSSKIEYRTLNDLAYDRIKDGRAAAAFHPGQVPVIRSLAETCGISTTPVRETLQRLVAERLLVSLQNRSIAVPALNRRTARAVVVEDLTVAGALLIPQLRAVEASRGAKPAA